MNQSTANILRSRQGEGRASVFVVDDEPLLLELAVTLLEPLGYEVKTFRDPGTALQAFVSARPLPILIITDYAMHSMTGLDLIRECRRIRPKQKIILLSGTVDESIYRDLPSKPDCFLSKPYQAKRFVSAVQSVLGA
jgi:CheY-like chemotaxis protein